MLDLRFIREHPEVVRRTLAQKHVDLDFDALLAHDQTRRDIIAKVDALKASRNELSAQVGTLMKAGQRSEADAIKAESSALGEEIAALDEQLRVAEIAVETLRLYLPNVPHESVPVGEEADNVIVKTVGDAFAHPFQARDHLALGKAHGLFDFERGGKITGSGFPVYWGVGAQLERALIAYMLDLHTRAHGYVEVMTPFIVNRDSMRGTGQVPKFEEDMYRCDTDDLFLIPTAEVPVTNLHRDETLEFDALPVRYCAYSPCFRREAGSYGRDTRGFLRVHEFNKVELVWFTEGRAEVSYNAHEELLFHAEQVLKGLGLTYRVKLLATGDLSFSAAKCFDLEAYAPVENKWLEVSSVSNFEDFQARRANIKHKVPGGKPQLVHTLNGSGLATSRVWVALLETYQNADGTITVPEVLRPWMGGRERIG